MNIDFAKMTARFTLQECYLMGQDYANNGANEINCDYRLFWSPEATRAWERGRDEVKPGGMA